MTSIEQASSAPLTWGVPWRLDRHGYAGLARFASTACLAPVGLSQHDQTDRLMGQGPAAVARDLFTQVAGRRWAYNLAPWHAGQGQLIRDATAIDRGSGTCLDIALLFAAMAKQAHLRPYLAIARRDVGTRPDHAFVIVDTSARAWDDEGTTLWSHGDLPALEVSLDKTWARFDTGLATIPDRWLALDVTEALWGSSRSRDFDHAQAVANEYLTGYSYEFIDLVDVVQAHRTGAEELEPPNAADRATIYRHIPQVKGVRPLPSRQPLIDAMSRESGISILVGTPGSGKSATALQAALGAASGAGWVLDASDAGTLRVSLAEAAMEALGQDPTGLDGNEITAYAANALERLHEASTRWVVVLDNADDEPDTYRQLMPRPGERQLVVITTTNQAWRTWAQLHGGVVHELPPLDETERREWLGGQEVEVPPVSPLELSLASRLVQHVPLPDDCALPHLVKSAMAELDDDGRRLAQAYAWLPPVAIPPAAVVDALATTAPSESASLYQLGLVEERDSGWVMHRQVRAALRDELAGEPATIFVSLMTSPSTSPFFQTSSSMGDLAEIHHMVIGSGLPDSDVAAVLFALGTSQERKNTKASAAWFEAALDRMGEEPQSAAEAVRRAGALQGIARARLRARTQISDARTLISEVDTLASKWPDDHDMMVAQSRAQAMIGLLDRQLAEEVKDRDARRALMREALDRIEASARRRAELVDPDSPDIDRSLFNIPGTLLGLAKDEDDQEIVTSLLQRADDLYDAVFTTRSRRYRTQDSEEVTAAVYGRALISYYRAVLLAHLTIDQRYHWLDDAGSKALQSEEVRVRLAAPARMSEHSAKSTALLAKARLVALQLGDIGGDVPDGYRSKDVVDQSQSEGAPPLGRLGRLLKEKSEERSE